jgi:hypothetical protein
MRITVNKLKYKILTKSEKYYWTVNSRIYSILLLTILPVFIKLNLFKNQNITFFDKSLMFIMVATLFCGIVIGLSKFNKYKTLKGELISDLEFQKGKIIIGDKEYLLNEIQKIEINAFDFRGEINTYRGNFDGNLSNGVNNLLKLYLANQIKLEINFQQIVKNEIRNEEEILIAYCNQNKLHYFNLLEILGINDYDEIQKFKKEKLTIHN